MNMKYFSASPELLESDGVDSISVKEEINIFQDIFGYIYPNPL